MLQRLTAAKEQAEANPNPRMANTSFPAPKLPPDRSTASLFGGSSFHLPPNGATSSRMDDSFVSNASTVFTTNNDSRNQSFITDATEVEADAYDTQESQYAAESVVEQWIQEDGSTETVKQRIINALLDNGPFSLEQPLPRSISLRCRHELERVGRHWGVPLRDMLRGDAEPNMDYDAFWSWIKVHSMRGKKELPEKPSRKAWESATNLFNTDSHSEVVVLSGILDWTTKSADEHGFFDLKLNAFKTERSCRFRRRFGSDRFLSLLMPPVAKPPVHLGAPSSPALLRDSISTWLTRNEHQCLGRTWRAMFIEDVQRKGKEALQRVHLFAVDGVDFCPPLSSHPLAVSPPKEASSAHTKMTIDALIEWHMPRKFNSHQSNTKLFQRFSLGFSKTYASVPLRPYQIVPVPDHRNGETVMNDGCALMSRTLANKICHHLGISGNTPSAFQGRIAGAKGLWMVDRHQSKYQAFAEEGEDIWLEITDSQLKIHPHPVHWKDPYDEEKLTFEVCKWSKPLHSVDLNIQILSILDYGSNSRSRGYLAELTRKGIDQLAEDFEDVLRSDNPVACRRLVQKFKPQGDAQYRQLDQWTIKDSEFIIRLSEAGFSPQSFSPLRRKLEQYFSWIMDRRIQDIRIEVPLSTYAFCIADPYGVLEPHEVYLGFSAAWRGHETFQSSIVEGDVLVARTPAHLPSDIQRRKAVFKSELRHFTDVIVFSTKGQIPLAHMLSGGDYDGDAPWICWDPELVDHFKNSGLPEELALKASHFGLTEHSIPMSKITSTEEFLHKTFLFNLTLSNLGRCTREHEKIQYELGLNHPSAREVGSLLGHLVDSRKGGVLLTDEAWKLILKRVSPRERLWPAYIPYDKKVERRHHEPKRENIVDYLKFFVADKQGIAVRTRINENFPEISSDQDLRQPWIQAQKAIKDDDTGSVEEVLTAAKLAIDEARENWNSQASEARSAQSASEFISEIPAPHSSRPQLHPLVHTWQNSPYEWRRVLASCLYWDQPNAKFTWYAYGDTLCDIKAETFSSRRIVNDIASIYRVNPKAVARFAPVEMEANEDEFGGGEELEAMLLGMEKFIGLEKRSPIE
ncbi:RNA-dependent RNA polymerase eukaryotic-type [Penicillium chermesinum]|nr:RNA-dependent RNA polymerase eukaryotic-type [Penicillium chermesinum]